ncbi:MAG: hypothetical protein IPO87_19415 [Flavobacteriales bacterium]|nr:hypothetical protein [Flavobacteriales bacterium]
MGHNGCAALFSAHRHPLFTGNSIRNAPEVTLPAQTYVLQVFDALGVELGSQCVVVLKRD